jgi:uncharacterized protein (DUF1499 family)
MKTYKMIGIAIGAVVIGVVVTLVVLNPNNHFEMSEDAADYLQTRHYEVPDMRVSHPNEPIKKPHSIQEIEEILSRQKTYGRSWRVVQTLTEKDLAIIRAEIPVLIFTHDLEVRIQFMPSENFNSSLRKATINIRSASRIGGSDLGENRRHVKQLLDEFDFAFGNDRLNNQL